MGPFLRVARSHWVSKLLRNMGNKRLRTMPAGRLATIRVAVSIFLPNYHYQSYYLSILSSLILIPVYHFHTLSIKLSLLFEIICSRCIINTCIIFLSVFNTRFLNKIHIDESTWLQDEFSIKMPTFSQILSKNSFVLEWNWLNLVYHSTTDANELNYFARYESPDNDSPSVLAQVTLN